MAIVTSSYDPWRSVQGQRLRRKRSPTALLPLLLLLLALGGRCAGAGEVECKGSHSGSVYCTWQGSSYRVTAVPTTFEARPHLFKRESMPWWHDERVAAGWAAAVNTTLHLTKDLWGPVFAYGRDGQGVLQGQQWFDYLDPPRADFSGTDEAFDEYFAVALKTDVPPMFLSTAAARCST